MPKWIIINLFIKKFWNYKKENITQFFIKVIERIIKINTKVYNVLNLNNIKDN